jgi:hypothetical protein
MVLIAATAVAFVPLRVLFARPGASLLDSFGYPICGVQHPIRLARLAKNPSKNYFVIFGRVRMV